MRIAGRIGLLVTTLVLAPSLGHATTAIALSNEAMALGADVIATGRCVEVRSAWEGGTLVTLATVALTDVIKGEAAGTITVVLPGGIDANRRFPVSMVYAGAPQVRVNEEVFLFLARDEAITSGLTVLGFSQGKFSIIADATGERVVSRNLEGVTLQSPAGTRRGTATRVPLAAFTREIRRYLQQP